MAAAAKEGTASAVPSVTLTWQQAIVGLYLVNDYARASADRPPSPDWFRRQGVLTGLTAGTTRRVALRLARSRECSACGAVPSENSEGDHIVAVARGGPAGIENYMPMCKSCNSSKGVQDLLEWWYRKRLPAARIPADVLTAYCRLMQQRLVHERSAGKPAPVGVVGVLSELAAPLGDDHRRALWERIRWVVGWPP